MNSGRPDHLPFAVGFKPSNQWNHSTEPLVQPRHGRVSDSRDGIRITNVRRCFVSRRVVALGRFNALRLFAYEDS